MPMNRALIKLFSAAHALSYRLTGGRVGRRIAGAPVLLLTTTGRKSGKRRTAPLLYLEDGENIVIVASNGGNDQHPLWWLNLKHDPEAQVRIGKTSRRVRAERADEQEWARLWPLLLEMYGSYQEYQDATQRRIPVVILRPV